MATAGFPGVFQTGASTGYLSIGAVQKNKTSAGFPGTFQAGTTTSYLNIGAVQKAVATIVTSKFIPRLTLMGVG